MPPGEFWATIERLDDFPRWWSWLRRFDADGGPRVGTRARCVVRGPFPYSLRFTVAVEEVVPERLVVTRVTGDLDGPARLEVWEHADGCEARMVWSLELRDRALRVGARLARPLMEWAHDWVIARGVEQFRRRALGR